MIAKLKKLKREPALVAVAVVALVNLALGQDSGLTVDTVETLILLVSGLFVRQQVRPVAGSSYLD